MGRDAVVAGAGIAGLAAALGLAREGWSVIVLERASELGEVGAGVALARNGVTALRGLGLEDHAIAELGIATRPAGTFDPDGRPILRIAPGVEGVSMRGVHRARLHAALLARVREAGVQVVTGATVTGVAAGQPDGPQALVVADGGEVKADLVVAADGVRSVVRAAVAPGATATYSGYSSWRAVVRLPRAPRVLLQYWGPHAEFGTMPVSEEETYWYGYVRMPAGISLPDEHAAALARFADWAARPVRGVIEQTDPAAVLRHDVLHLPGGMPSYAVGRVVAAGDAAHAALPTTGQGAALALEDGLSVGRIVGRGGDGRGALARALARYDEVRRPRGDALARAALMSGQLGAHLGTRGQTVRNRLLSLVPTAALSRSADAVMGWTAP